MKINKLKIMKEKEDVELDLLRSNIKHSKKRLDIVIRLFTKYAFVEVATGAIFYEDLYHKKMSACMDMAHKKDEPFHKTLFEMIGFGQNPTEKEKLEQELEYYNKLLSLANSKLKSLPEDIKRKIVKDGFKNHDAWNLMWSNFSKLSALPEPKKKKVKK